MPTKPTIQIIESDNFLAGIYARKFEADGWKVLVAESFPEAKKQRARKKLSALIIEPDTNISQAAAAIKDLRGDASTASLPILILSTISEKAEIDELRRAGASAYLIKGHFVPAEVVRKVKGMV